MVSSTTRLALHGVDSVAKPDEKAFEVVLAGFFNLITLHADVINRKLLAGDEFVQVKAQGGDVLGQVLGFLLKGHEDAGITEIQRLSPGTRLPEAFSRNRCRRRQAWDGPAAGRRWSLHPGR